MKEAVIVVDMINDFVTGRFGSEGARAILGAIRSLLEGVRKQGVPVIYLRDAHTKVDRELEVWGEHAMAGTWGSEIVPELEPHPGDLVIEKHWYSGFVDTPLSGHLRNLGVDTLIFVGVSTDICVQNNVASAYFQGYKTVVVSDCTAALKPQAHQYALEYMKQIYGTEIVTSQELLKERV